MGGDRIHPLSRCSISSVRRADAFSVQDLLGLSAHRSDVGRAILGVFFFFGSSLAWAGRRPAFDSLPMGGKPGRNWPMQEFPPIQ